MQEAKILVVDDEPNIVDTVRAYLEKEGYAVYTALDGPSALKAARAYRPDLIVLDIMLPGMDGIEVLRRLRQESDVYVLMLTAKTEETDKVVGLSVGADDYGWCPTYTKPFSPRELVARVRAILRRGRGGDMGEPALTFQRLRIDADARRVWKDDAQVDLTPIEYDLLYALARHSGMVLSREQLIQQVWGHDYSHGLATYHLELCVARPCDYGDERVVDVHIGRLRKKIEDDPSDPELVVTVRGAGYRFEGEP